jgi:hypothetical protein
MLLPELGFIQNGSLFKENAQPSHAHWGEDQATIYIQKKYNKPAIMKTLLLLH